MISSQGEKNCKSSKNIPPAMPQTDEATKAALVQAGGEEWSIYTKDELRTPNEQNHIASLSPAELRKLHEIKRIFNARVFR